MAQAASKILEFLAAFRRRVLWLEFFIGLCLLGACLAGGLLLGAAVWSKGRSLGWVRPLIWLFFAGATLVVAARFWIRPRLRLRLHSVALARLAERRLDDERLELVSAVQFAGSGAPRAGSGTSPALMEAHLERVALRLRDLRPGRLVKWRSTLIPLCFLLGLGVSLAGTGLLWPEAVSGAMGALWEGPEAGALAADDAGPGWVGDIRLEYRYPAYSGRDDVLVEGTDGTVMVLPGTQVSLRARADRPIAEGRLLIDENEVALRVSQDRGLSADWVVDRAGAYRFSLRSQAGETWRSPRGHAIHLEADRPPRVSLSQPAQDRVIREKDSVDLLFDARDDFGLGELRLAWRVLGRSEGERDRVLRRLDGRVRKVNRQSFRWQLAPLRLRAGEQVQFFVEATDNDTVRGPKKGRSRTVTLKVFSADAHHRELMKQVQAFWEHLLGGLADHLEREGEARETLAAHVELQQGLVRLGEEAGRLITALGKDRLAWAPLIDALQNTQQGLRRQGDRVSWMLEAAVRRGKAQPEELRTLAGQRTRRVVKLEKDVLYLEDLLDLERLEDLDRIAADLKEAQRRLADLMARYQKAPTDEIRREIEAEIARIKEQMARLMARQGEVLRAVRDEYFNPEAIERAMSQRDLMAGLDRIQALMMEGKVDQAVGELARLRQQLANLQQAISQSRSGFGSQRYQELAKAMAKAQSELNQIVEQQTKVADRTRQLMERAVARLRAKMGPQVDRKLAGLVDRVREIQDLIEKVGEKGLDPFASRDRQQLLAGLTGLVKLLEAADLARAIEEAREARRYADRLAATLELHRRMAPRRMSAKRVEQGRQAAEKAAALQRDLERLLPSGRELLSGEEARQAQSLGQQQAELERRLSRLRGEMEKLNEKAPLFGRDMMSGLDRGSRAMRQASDGLGELDPRSAHPHQQSALSELEKLQQGMQKSCKNCQGGGMPLPMGRSAGRAGGGDGPGGQANLEEVEIPGEDEYEAPEAFRKELLDGMKDPVPDDFQPQVRRYYEELVK